MKRNHFIYLLLINLSNSWYSYKILPLCRRKLIPVDQKPSNLQLKRWHTLYRKLNTIESLNTKHYHLKQMSRGSSCFTGNNYSCTLSSFRTFFSYRLYILPFFETAFYLQMFFIVSCQSFAQRDQRCNKRR